MTTEQHTAQDQLEGAGTEQVIAQNREASPGIDPEKLLELAKSRHHDGGVTLGWPTVIKIVEELRQGRGAAEERDALTNRVQFLNAQNSAQQEQHDALAAHVERLIRGGRYLHHELQQWSLTERDPETSAAMSTWDVIVDETPATSRARREAEKQAEAIDRWSRSIIKLFEQAAAKHATDPNYPAIGLPMIRELCCDMDEDADRLRRQAKEAAE